MGVMDKFLNYMKLDGEDDYYDEEDDYLDEPAVEEKPKKTPSVLSKESAADEDDKRRPAAKVTPMRSSKKSGGDMKVCVFKPTTFEETREITETLLANRTVVLNLEGLEIEIAQRIIDFTAGSSIAIGGNLQQISRYIFIVTPASVDISGDIQEILTGSLSN